MAYNKKLYGLYAGALIVFGGLGLMAANAKAKTKPKAKLKEPYVSRAVEMLPGVTYVVSGTFNATTADEIDVMAARLIDNPNLKDVKLSPAGEVNTYRYTLKVDANEATKITVPAMAAFYGTLLNIEHIAPVD
jgi:hypothetical protein